MQKVFLSHGRADKPFVRLVAAELREAGLAPWLDEVELLPGDSLIGSLSRAVADSDYVVAFLSPTSVTSPWVEEELAIGLTVGIEQKRIVVLPILLPGLESQHIPAFLRARLYIDLRVPANYDMALTQLYRRLLPGTTEKDDEILKVRHININAERAEHLVSAARHPANREWITHYLADHLAGSQKNRDHTERHFVYWALGEIGGPVASDLVQAGLQETDKFARLGAEIAWRQLTRAAT
jgi:hypothetical protein